MTKIAILTLVVTLGALRGVAANAGQAIRDTTPPPDSATIVRRAIAILRADDITEDVEVGLYKRAENKTVIELRVPGGGFGGHFVVTTIPGKVCLEIYE